MPSGHTALARVRRRLLRLVAPRLYSAGGTRFYHLSARLFNWRKFLECRIDQGDRARKNNRCPGGSVDWCSGKVGLYGTSRGGEHALLLTSLMVRDRVDPLPSAVAVHAPSDVICGGFDARQWRDKGDPGWKVWDPAERAWTWRGASDALKPTTPIEIERYEGPIFISHGTADNSWSVEMTRRLEARLIQHGRCPEVHYYDGQPHTPSGEAMNLHLRRLIAFFDQHLCSNPSIREKP